MCLDVVVLSSLSFLCIYGCATIRLVLVRVVVSLLVDMPQSSPCAGAVVLVLVRFSKINRMTEFLSCSLKTRLLMIINTIQVGCSPHDSSKKQTRKTYRESATVACSPIGPLTNHQTTLNFVVNFRVLASISRVFSPWTIS
jgi:hypothetical protein